MLTVALDATPLVGDRTGIGVAVSGMVRSLASLGELDLVGYGLTAAGWRRVRAALPAGVRPSRGPMPAGVLLSAWSRFSFPAIEIWTGPVDVVHGTNFVVPPARRASRIVSVWDLTSVRYPEMCTATARRYPELVRKALEQGAWVHTGSHFVAEEIASEFSLERDRILVIPPGVTATVRAADAGPGRGSRPYILTIGTVEPRKDVPGVVKAFDAIAAEHPDLELWIAGPEGWGEQQLSEAVSVATHRDRIRRLGWVPDAGAVLAGAALLAYPSLYEGFGFPPLEAMAAGVPVVATAAGSLPEVTGEAALLVPPGDTDALGAAMSKVLGDSGLRDSLVERGRARVATFSWKTSARRLSEGYQRVAAAWGIA